MKRCRGCGESGHNITTCGRSRKPKREPGAPKACSQCGNGGHYATTCPLRSKGVLTASQFDSVKVAKDHGMNSMETAQLRIAPRLPQIPIASSKVE